MTKWKEQEIRVGYLESAIQPNARVTRPRKKLKDKAGNPQQLDVLIEVGPPIRQTRSLVEVQKRKGKVGLEVFRSWRDKKRTGGYSSLICVSAEGFTRDVIRLVKHDHPHGDVRLGLLKDVDLDRLPTWISKKFEVEASYIDVLVRSGILFCCKDIGHFGMLAINRDFEIIKDLPWFEWEDPNLSQNTKLTGSDFLNKVSGCFDKSTCKFNVDDYKGLVDIDFAKFTPKFYFQGKWLTICRMALRCQVKRVEKILEKELFLYEEVYPTSRDVGYFMSVKNLPCSDGSFSNIPMVFLSEDAGGSVVLFDDKFLDEKISVSGKLNFNTEYGVLKKLYFRTNQWVTINTAEEEYRDMEIDFGDVEFFMDPKTQVLIPKVSYTIK